MPVFDGTGPCGVGSMSGRGMGNCAQEQPRGRGRGCCRGSLCHAIAPAGVLAPTERLEALKASKKRIELEIAVLEKEQK